MGEYAEYELNRAMGLGEIAVTIWSLVSPRCCDRTSDLTDDPK